ncbi:MAG: precorrin-8X methylmutase [Desulfomonilaceae bacterium]
MNNTPQGDSNRKPLIRTLYETPMTPEEIEKRSFGIIDATVPRHGLSPYEWEVVRRMIHTTADTALVDKVKFSPHAIEAAIQALQSGKKIFVDSNMIRSGLSIERLREIHPDYSRNDIFCHVSDADVVSSAKTSGLPRSLFAVRKAKTILDGGIAVFGNSPVALMELNRLVMEEGIRPALVVAMPVGFVHVAESKEELMSLGLPYIALVGRRGGSPLAVSVIHALCSVAQTKGGIISVSDESCPGSPKTAPLDKACPQGSRLGRKAIILLGHGSRVPDAGKHMEKVASGLKSKYGYNIVEICYMSRLGPHFPEVFEKCVSQGATEIMVIPYFLHDGLHLVLDIPEMMQKIARSHPGIKLVLGQNLGFDDVLVDLVQRRIADSKDDCDVRELTLPPRQQYPVPPGQPVFVAMAPEEAARFLREKRNRAH